MRVCSYMWCDDFSSFGFVWIRLFVPLLSIRLLSAAAYIYFIVVYFALTAAPAIYFISNMLNWIDIDDNIETIGRALRRGEERLAIATQFGGHTRNHLNRLNWSSSLHRYIYIDQHTPGNRGPINRNKII